MSEFAKGDQVKLKSGGPVMTVDDVGNYGPLRSENGVKCVWFEMAKGVSTVRDYVFDASNLEKYEKPDLPAGPLRVRPLA